MAETCIFPLCKSVQYKDEFCLSHAKYFSKGEVKKAPVKIAVKSEKRKKEDKEYKKIVKELLEANPYCQIRIPGVCKGKAQGLHHLQKRSPKNLTNKKNLVTACNHCNQYIENNPKDPLSLKFTISRFKKI